MRRSHIYFGKIFQDKRRNATITSPSNFTGIRIIFILLFLTQRTFTTISSALPRDFIDDARGNNAYSHHRRYVDNRDAQSW